LKWRKRNRVKIRERGDEEGGEGQDKHRYATKIAVLWIQIGRIRMFLSLLVKGTVSPD
jgi:hypothetical protein